MAAVWGPKGDGRDLLASELDRGRIPQLQSVVSFAEKLIIALRRAVILAGM